MSKKESELNDRYESAKHAAWLLLKNIERVEWQKMDGIIFDRIFVEVGVIQGKLFAAEPPEPHMPIDPIYAYKDERADREDLERMHRDNYR